MALLADRGQPVGVHRVHDRAELDAQHVTHHIRLEVPRRRRGEVVGAESGRNRPRTRGQEVVEGIMSLIESLTLTMNKARQATITREILEIVSGAEAIQ